MEPRCGEALCKMFPPDENVDLSSIARKARKSARSEGGHQEITERRERGSFRGRHDFIRLETLGKLCSLLIGLCARYLKVIQNNVYLKVIQNIVSVVSMWRTNDRRSLILFEDFSGIEAPVNYSGTKCVDYFVAWLCA